MRRRVLSWLPWLIGLGLLAIVFTQVSLRETVTALGQLAPLELLWLLLLNGGVLLALTGRWWIILQGQGHRLPLGQLFLHRLAAFGLSYYTPGPLVGGEPLQVLLIEREHGVPRTTAVAAVTLDKLLELLVNFLFLAVGASIIVQTQFFAGAGWPSIGFALLLVALPLLFLWATWAGKRPLSRLLRLGLRLPLPQRWRDGYTQACDGMARSEAEATRFCRRSPLALLAALFISLLSVAGMMLEYWLMVSFLGVRLSLFQLIITLTAARVTTLLIVPAGIGTLETSQLLVFSSLGLSPAISLSASVIIRARDMLVGAAGLWWGWRRLGWGRRAEGVRD